MARLWTCGFELQSATDGVEIDNNYGGGINTTTKRSGAASRRLNGTIVTMDVAGFDHQFSTGSATVYARYWFNIASLTDSASVALYLDLLSGATNVISVQVVNVAGSYNFTVYYNNFASSLTPFNLSSPTNTWHCIETFYDTSPANGSEVLTVKLDGTTAATISTLNYTNKTVNTIGVGIYNGTAGSITDSDCYIDDLAVNDSSGSDQNSWCGIDGKVVHLKPNAQGDNNGWLKQGGGAGSSTNYQDVDEVTPDDATTYVKRTSGTPIDDHNIESSSTGGIGASDTISFVAVGVRAGSTSATAAAGRQLTLRLKSAASGTLQTTTGIDISINGWISHKDPVAHTYQLTSYTDPTTGVAWTPTGTNSLDNAQIGITPTSSSTNEIRVSTLWLLVEYIVASGSNYTQDCDEDITLTDTLVKQTSRSLLETVTLTDTLAKSSARAFTETITLTDAFVKQAGKALIETITLTDALIKQTAKALLETITATDTLAKQTARSFTDSITLSDTFGAISIYLKNLTETITLTDTISRSISKMLADTVTLTDTVVRSISRALTETITLTGSLAKQLARSLTDSITLTDSLARTIGKALIDTITLTDSITRSIGKALLDTVTLTDTIRKQLSRALADTITLTDSLARQAGKALADTITLADTLTRTAGKTLADTITLTATMIRNLSRALIDTVTLTDSLSIQRSLSRMYSETLTLTDSIAKSTARLLTETITLSDVLLALIDRPRIIGNFILHSIYGIIARIRGATAATNIVYRQTSITIREKRTAPLLFTSEKSAIIRNNKP